MKTLFLSIWHDFAPDQWATAFGTTEAKETKKIIDAIILRGIPWVKLVKVPEWLTLPYRTSWINAHFPDYSEPFAVELHLDAWPASAQGASAWFCAGNTYTQNEATQFLQKYTQITGEPSRHVNPDTSDRLGRLGFVRDTKCASLLIELGFITNQSELNTIRTKAVDWIIAGILNMNSI